MNRKPKIRKSLFIGLGGTGAKSLIALKKRFYEVYGHVDEANASMPDFVKFMVFDTDAQGTREESKTKARNATNGKEFPVEFSPAEVIPMKAPDCGEFIMSESNQDQFDWMPLENRKVLNALNDLDKGAGQVRLFGRVAHFFNYADVRNALSDGINEVRLARHGNVHFEPLGDDDIEIHIVASLGGGTGSGMFMDVGMLVREILDNQDVKAKINGYFVLPDIFWRVASPQDMKRVKPNSIGALRELDFFMELVNGNEARAQKNNGNEDRMTAVWNPETSPLHESDNRDLQNLAIRYIGGQETQLTNKPYSNVYLVDSENRDGGTFDRVEDLAGTIAKGLFASVSSMSVGLDSVDDNDKDGMQSYNHKLGWVGSIGVSELIYNLPEVRRHLSLRVVEKGLASLLQPSESMAAKAQVLMEEAGMTEVGDRSDLVNAIYKATPLQAKELYEDADPAVERSAAMGQVHKCYDVLQSEADKVLAKAIDVIHGMDQHLPDAGRIHARIDLLQEIKTLAVTFREEVKADQKQLKSRLDDLEKGLFNGPDSTENRLKELLASGLVRRLLRKREIQDESHAWQEETFDLMKLTLKGEAMEKALDVLSGISRNVDERLDRFEAEKGNLTKLQSLASGEVAERNRSGLSRRKATPFLLQMHCDDMNESIDLGAMNNWNAGDFLDGVSNVVSNPSNSDTWIGEACQFVQGQNYGLFDGYSGARAEKMTRSLLLKKIEEGKGQQPQYTEVGKLMLDLMNMSSPMIKIDYGAHRSQDGMRLEQCMRKAFVVCVPADDDNDSLVEALKDLTAQIKPPGQVTINIQPVPDQSDRVTIYQRLSGAPVCSMAGFASDHQDYLRRHDKDNGEVFHVNYNWFDVMDQVKHSLTEGASASGEQAMENWTKAFLLGLIHWDSGAKAWRVEGGTTAPAVIKDKDRFELYRHLMEECDYGHDIERMLRHRLTNVDPMIISKRLKEIMGRDENGTVNFTRLPDDAKKGRAYFGDPSVNPYVDSRTETDMYGEAAYNRLGQKNALDILKEEGVCLKALFEKEAKG